MNTKRAYYFNAMLPTIEQLMKDLPEECESRTKLQEYIDLPPKDLVVKLDTDCDFGIDNIDELKEKYNVSCEHDGDGEFVFCLPVPVDRDEAIKLYKAFASDVVIYSRKAHMQARFNMMIASSLESLDGNWKSNDCEVCNGNQTMWVELIGFEL